MSVIVKYRLPESKFALITDTYFEIIKFRPVPMRDEVLHCNGTKRRQ